jgi:hypothetical protein
VWRAGKANHALLGELKWMTIDGEVRTECECSRLCPVTLLCVQDGLIVSRMVDTDLPFLIVALCRPEANLARVQRQLSVLGEELRAPLTVVHAGQGGDLDKARSAMAVMTAKAAESAAVATQAAEEMPDEAKSTE